MAHIVTLNQLSYDGDNNKIYIQVLFNLDTVVSIEPSPSGKHSIIITRWNNNGVRVRETLDEILKLTHPCCHGDNNKTNQLNG